MFAAQTMIGPERPALQQREGAVAPGQDDAGRHVPDNARIVSVVAREPRIGGMAVGDQRRAGLTLARTKVSIDLAELSAIADRRNRPERVSRYFAPLRLSRPREGRGKSVPRPSYRAPPHCGQRGGGRASRRPA
jgi:hypothetical protein